MCGCTAGDRLYCDAVHSPEEENSTCPSIHRLGLLLGQTGTSPVRVEASKVVADESTSYCSARVMHGAANGMSPALDCNEGA